MVVMHKCSLFWNYCTVNRCFPQREIRLTQYERIEQQQKIVKSKLIKKISKSSIKIFYKK